MFKFSSRRMFSHFKSDSMDNFLPVIVGHSFTHLFEFCCTESPINFHVLPKISIHGYLLNEVGTLLSLYNRVGSENLWVMDFTENCNFMREEYFFAGTVCFDNLNKSERKKNYYF